MSKLTILSGAGINIGVSDVCPEQQQMLNFTYQKISRSVYARIDERLRALFSEESFDYILGGLLTINLTIEKTKQDLRRFRVDENAFAQLFGQPDLQTSIQRALDQIEKQLTLSLDQMLSVVSDFNPAITALVQKFDSINYFTTNFDGIFDHIIYGPRYSRGSMVTDFWNGDGTMNRGASRKVKIHHLHGDIRYKPHKVTRSADPLYQWPVLVVGDQEVKKGLIASQDSLRFYNNKFNKAMERCDDGGDNVLAIIGFGFRGEDDHIVTKIKSAIEGGVFNRIYIFDPEDRLSGLAENYTWIDPRKENLIAFLGRL